jgi:MFS transporter, MHS family, shikimate and dehydroshikimate transport protein
MESVGGEETGRRTSIWTVALASFVGSTVEWYDFFIYGTATALVFGQLFFPTESPVLGTLSAFATFGVGFLFRPPGGAFFGHFGDRIGRKSMLAPETFRKDISAADSDERRVVAEPGVQ